ncbi:FAST kinase domain-containing protein 4 isoform X1 [Podarcis muralis]
MAAKLLHRYYRLSRLSSPLCARAHVASAGSKMVMARGPPQTPSAPLTAFSLSRPTDKLSVKEQADRALPERSELEDIINSASTAEELLHLEELYAINANQAAVIISRLSRLVAEKKLDPDSILQDVRFQDLLQIIHRQGTQVWNTALVNLFRSLDLLGLERSRPEMRSVEQEVRWRLRRLTFKNLAFLAEHVAASVPKGHPSELLSDVLKHLELRWTEISDVRTVVMLMSKVGPLSPALMERLEDKSLELAEQFTPEDTRRVAVALAIQNRRSIPLLRAISYHLVQKHFTFSTSILLDLAFAYGKLGFHQTQVFQKIAADLHPRVPELSPGDVVRCLKSFAYLKWLNLPLFEAFAQHTVDNAEKYSLVHLSNVVLAFARLNFHPSCRDAFYSTVHRGMENHLDDLDPYLLLDLVWSLCVLQQAKASHLQKVLEPEFRTRFLDDPSARGHNYRLKLIHVNTAACLECADYAGPLLLPEALGSKELQGGRKLTPLQSSLREVLQVVAGDPAKVRFEVDTDCGWLLDAEMVLNADNQPLPVADFTAPAEAQSEGPKHLPPGARRLAFLGWEFPNFSNRSKDLLGRFAMARRHVQASGFLVVDVPYYEWLDLKSEWQKTAYLKDKMGKAVAEEMAK